jgi:hypothetical protein
MSLILSGTDGLSDVDGSAAAPAIRGTDPNTGMFFPAADTIAFSEGGVESMRLDSSGNLGIGTSSPTVPLTIGDSTAPANVTNLSAMISTNTAAGSSLTIRKSNTGSNNPNMSFLKSRGTNVSPTIVSAEDGTGAINCFGFDGTNYINNASIAFVVDGTPGTNDMPGRIVFATTADGASATSERMRINSSGFVGIGTTSPTTALQVNGTVTAPVIADTQGGSVAPISSVMRNRIINGAMVIDQRNAGASITPTSTGALTYGLDRWGTFGAQASKFSVQQNAGSVTPPTGFTNYLGITSLATTSVTGTDSYIIQQEIEGFNVADLGWGAANAQTVTLSFWVRSSLTGTFGGALRNSDNTRSYPYSYTITAANTWEQKSVTITGDTTGTWLKNNGRGIRLAFGLGVGSTSSGTAGAWAAGNFLAPTGATSVVGTNGATFYITGVQLEKGTQATSFEYRQYTTELQLCQRYFTSFGGLTVFEPFGQGVALSGTTGSCQLALPTAMRSTVGLTSVSPSLVSWSDGTTSGTLSAISLDTSGINVVMFNVTFGTGTSVTSRPLRLFAGNSLTPRIQISSEL